ncbi:hypothetical protein FQN51_009090 [Onygenales sp. PD_10]|nr:hypothetical protein FQN51_009090 [Onygenales sp. PD_10]
MNQIRPTMGYKLSIIIFLSAIPLAIGTPYRPHHGLWKDLPPIPIAPRQEHSTVAISRSTIAILGGIVPEANSSISPTTTLVQLYNIQKNTWHSAAPLPIALNHPNVAAVHGRIYVLGGLTPDPEGAWRSVPDSWVYDPESDVWESIQPMPAGQERGSAAVGVDGHIIWLAGGMKILVPREGGEQTSVNLVSAYDTVSDTWLSLPTAVQNMPGRRDHAGAAVIHSKFYVVGGRDSGQFNVQDTVNVLDLSALEDGWTIAEGRMPTPRGGIATAAVGSQIYTFGGEGNPEPGSAGVFNETEVYNTATGQWRKLGPMKLPRHGTYAVAVDSTVYIPGGGISIGAGPVASFDLFYP